VKPILSKPDSNSVSTSLTVALTWGAQAATDSAYIVDVSQASNFSSIQSRDTTTATTITKVMPSDSTVYYWRVKGGSVGSGWSAQSNIWKFTVYRAIPKKSKQRGGSNLWLGIGIRP
jgi:hypothetical protein